AALVRRGIWLSYTTIGYNTLEAIGSLVAGVLAGSVALVGFGIDSVIEVTASLAAQWRLRSDVNPSRREHAELLTFRIVGFCFVALRFSFSFVAPNPLPNGEDRKRVPSGMFV